MYVYVLYEMLECAWTCMNVESVRYVCVTVFESPCAMWEGGRSLRQPGGNGGWSFTDIVSASEGNSINITCSTSEDLLGIYLKKTWPCHSNVIYFEDGENATVDKEFSGRIDFSGSQNNLTITIRLLRQADTGVYTCQAVTKIKKEGPSTMLVVTGRGCPHLLLARPGACWLPGSFFSLSGTVCSEPACSWKPPVAPPLLPL